MGMIAHFYSVERNSVENVKAEISQSFNGFSEVISDPTKISGHLDIDKSWLNLVEVFKDINNNNPNVNLGEIMFYGAELNKKYHPDGIINFLMPKGVDLIHNYLNNLSISSQHDFIEIYNSTTFTNFGKIDYSDSYDYLYTHFSNLKRFYSKCKQDQSGVIISIG